MLKRSFDVMKTYLCVVYLRMSSGRQNKRSPDQQLDEIKRTLKRLGYPWRIIKVYRDDAKSGRYIRQRKQYQKMILDIKLGVIEPDIILVDTCERFGRVEELPSIRKGLYEKCGVLLMTADTNFADPTTPQGKALGGFEAMRASEDGRVKAHNVTRGKMDAINLKHWPGGPCPFGFQLKNIMTMRDGREEVDYSVLEPQLLEAWIMKLLFREAAATGKGQTLLAKFLNNHPEIPPHMRNFQAATIGYWLDNPICIGTLRWNLTSTDVIDDTRVIEGNKPEDVIYVENFCDPIVAIEDWNIVQATRDARRKPKGDTDDQKHITPLAPGMTLKYLLTGLVRCGECSRSMAPSSSSEYTTVAGESRRYVHYHCAGHSDGTCKNAIWVSEAWLRSTVLTCLRNRLFPATS